MLERRNMNNDIKRNNQASNKQEGNVALLQYQLNSSRKENRKNILIAALVVGIIAFASGFIFRDFDRSEVNALRNSNLELREEIQSLKAEAKTNSQEQQ